MPRPGDQLFVTMPAVLESAASTAASCACGYRKLSLIASFLSD